jgi:ribosomal protein S18 acetylase RimI-like enzyme
MNIEPFDTNDIDHFLLLATDEGWMVEPWEFEFLLSEFSRGCFAARAKSGELLGFVTSLRHQRSGWIGNLIVTPAYRGRGIGERLFKKAMEVLLASGAETVWLTASKSGLPLYQKSGFTRIDTIIRWSGSAPECRKP